ncbi:hypothetical protein V8J82_21535 [Gymnodinialimonas sp. 2305UL16-5]|uniref:hypothetical protein n=1 Tax=Gymnodinialimonas mytili TaxID=3126503 RepID=UPI003096947C
MPAEKRLYFQSLLQRKSGSKWRLCIERANHTLTVICACSLSYQAVFRKYDGIKANQFDGAIPKHWLSALLGFASQIRRRPAALIVPSGLTPRLAV